MDKVLITGITGFAGSHLAEFLLAEGLDVIGIMRPRSRTENIEGFRNKVRLVEADIRDASSMVSIVQDYKPSIIFHLAAQAFVPMSWKAPSETLTTNIIGTTNILEAVRLVHNVATVHVSCTSEEYGLVCSEDLPIKDTCPLKPQSPYGVSKVACDLLAQQYYRSYGIKTIITRAFNHTGKRRGESYVSSSFAKQLIEIEKGKREYISVGNLGAKRDFSDVRDIVRGYWLATLKCNSGEPYNICSGVAISINDLLLRLAEKTSVKLKVKQDVDRMRPSDVPMLVGDCSKFKKVTGWYAKYSFDDTLTDLLEFWRTR